MGRGAETVYCFKIKSSYGLKKEDHERIMELTAGKHRGLMGGKKRTGGWGKGEQRRANKMRV